jgi:hypothetical protein
MTCVLLWWVLLQEYEAESDENNAALSRMRNALVTEVEQTKEAEGGAQ